MSKNVAVVLVTFNRKELLLNCLNALMRQTYSISKMFIIDNASTDGTYYKLKEEGFVSEDIEEIEKLNLEYTTKHNYKGCEINYTRLSKNTGGSGGFHEGVKRAYNSGCEWIWIMDDDVMPNDDCLSKLMEKSDRYNAIIPLRIDRKKAIIEFASLNYDLTKPFLINNKITILDTYKDVKDMPETLIVHDFPFEGPLVKREIIEKIGFPKKDMFLYGDDTDYALRIRYIAKEEIVLVRDAILNRMLDFADSDEFNWKAYYKWRNYFYLQKQYGENVMVRLKPVSIFLGIVLKNILKLKWDQKKVKVLYYSLVDCYKKELPLRYSPGSKV